MEQKRTCIVPLRVPGGKGMETHQCIMGHLRRKIQGLDLQLVWVQESGKTPLDSEVCREGFRVES